MALKKKKLYAPEGPSYEEEMMQEESRLAYPEQNVQEELQQAQQQQQQQQQQPERPLIGPQPYEEQQEVRRRPSIMSMPPPPPLLMRPRPPNNAPLQMTSQPANRLPRLPPMGRKQVPFLASNPQRLRPPTATPPKPNNRRHQGNQQQNQRIPSQVQRVQLSSNEYRQKLKDPNFHQNLVKAHVYHAVDLGEDELEVSDSIFREESAPLLPSGPVSYIQDANPYGPFRLKERHEQDIAPEYLRENVIPDYNQEIQEAAQTSIDLENFAPASRSSKKEENEEDKVYKPEVGQAVYRPEYTTAATTTTSTESTTSSTTTTEVPTTTTTTTDPIADHVSLLLQQYFSTQTQDDASKQDAVPMITYNDENDSIVMEYLSPDGTQEQAPETVSGESSSSPDEKLFVNNYPESDMPQNQDFLLPSFMPVPENPELLTLPQMSDMDRFFTPSKTPSTADWFVLDDEGRRRIIDNNEVIPEEPLSFLPFDENQPEETQSDDIDATADDDTNETETAAEENPVIERETVGDFQPSLLHSQSGEGEQKQEQMAS